MNIRAGLVCAGVALVLSTPALAQPLSPVPYTEGPQPVEARYLGVGSCATAGCHNRPHGSVGAEVGLWLRDPHANAYDVLRTTRSQQMVARLGYAEPATKVGICLECHSVNAPLHRQAEVFAVSEGVSCEACHGAADMWLSQHFRPEWKGFSPQEKAGWGMRDLTTVASRVGLCTECHTGSKGRMVNHDLIGAGHPPLRFEASAFHDAMPKHWHFGSSPAEADPAFKARMWLAGQAAMLRQQLELLAESPTATVDWSHFNCTACHQNVGTGAKTARSGLKPTVVWEDWMLSLSGKLEAHSAVPAGLSGQLEQITRPTRPLTTLSAEADQARIGALALAGEWEQAALSTNLDPNRLQSLLKSVAETSADTSGSDWYDAWQRYLGLRAIYLSRRNMGAVDPVLEGLLNDLRPTLAAPSRFGASDRESPQKAQAIFTSIREHLSR